MNIAGMLVKKGLRLLTLSGNIGKCPECGRIQFVDEVPELRSLATGTYTDLTWKCVKCETPMTRAEKVKIPDSVYNARAALSENEEEIDDDDYDYDNYDDDDEDFDCDEDSQSGDENSTIEGEDDTNYSLDAKED